MTRKSRANAIVLIAALSITSAFGMNDQKPTIGADASNALSRECSEQWSPLYGKYRNDPTAFEAQWRALEDRCKGTGIYEYRLASLMMLNGKLSDAKALVDESFKLGLPLHDNFEILDATYDFDALIQSKPADSKKINAAVAKLEELKERLPHSDLALLNVSVAHLYQRRFSDALDDSQKLVAHNDGLWEAHRNLAIALVYTGHYPEAAQEATRVLSMNPKVQSDVDFMLALATLQFNKGQVAEAHSTLSAFEKAVPAAKNDAGFIARSKALGFNP